MTPRFTDGDMVRVRQNLRNCIEPKCDAVNCRFHPRAGQVAQVGSVTQRPENGLILYSLTFHDPDGSVVSSPWFENELEPVR